ncbi:MAG: hypothetical protein PHH77_06495 [Victivallaceae bacterium]|nr:hypothetical protein [Victivallaceae bacterium]
MNNIFNGAWEIIETEMWAKEDLDLVDTATINFDGERGDFHFICVEGYMDVEYIDGKAEFCWQGHDEGDEVCGRGYATIDGDEITGRIYFCQGDNSSFRAKKM